MNGPHLLQRWPVGGYEATGSKLGGGAKIVGEGSPALPLATGLVVTYSIGQIALYKSYYYYYYLFRVLSTHSNFRVLDGNKSVQDRVKVAIDQLSAHYISE